MKIRIIGKQLITLILVILMIATPLLAQQTENEYFKGKIDGENAGKEAGASILWYFAGCFLTWIGVLMAYIIEPDVPAQDLLGKSPEYVSGYNEGYKRTVRNKQLKMALFGVATDIAVYCIGYILLWTIIIGGAASTD